MKCILQTSISHTYHHRIKDTHPQVMTIYTEVKRYELPVMRLCLSSTHFLSTCTLHCSFFFRKCKKECLELYISHKKHTKICQHVERNIAVAQQRFWHQLCFGNYSYPTPTRENLIMHQWRESGVLWRVNEIFRVENQIYIYISDIYIYHHLVQVNSKLFL